MIIIHIIDPCEIPILYGAPTNLKIHNFWAHFRGKKNASHPHPLMMFRSKPAQPGLSIGLAQILGGDVDQNSASNVLLVEE